MTSYHFDFQPGDGTRYDFACDMQRKKPLEVSQRRPIEIPLW